MFRRLFTYVAGAVGILLFLIALVAIFLTLPPGERWLKSIAEEQIGASVGRTVQIGSLETNLWSRVTLDNVDIAGRDGDDRMGSLHMAKIELRYGLLSALGERFSISSIFVDSLHVTIYRDSTGLLVLPFEMVEDALLAAEPPSEPMSLASLPVSIDTAAFSTITFEYRDVSLSLETVLREGSIGLRRVNDNSYRVNLALDDLAGVLDNITFPPIDIALHAVLAPDSVSLDTLAVRIADIHLAAAGTLLLGADTTVFASLAINGRPDSLVQPILRYLDLPDVQLSGDLDISASAEGEVGSVRSNAAATLPGVSSGGISAERSRLVITYSADTLSVQSLHIPTFGGLVEGSAQIVMGDHLRTSASLSLTSIDMEEVWAALHEDESPYGGRFSGSLLLANDGEDIADWTVDGTLYGRQLTYRSRSMPELTAAVALRDGNFSLAIQQAELSMDVTATIRNDELAGRFSLAIPRLDVISGLANIDGMTGVLGGSGSLSGTTDNPTIIARIHGSAITYENFPVDELLSEITYRDSLFSIQSLTISGVLDSVSDDRPLFGIDSLSGGLEYTLTAHGTLDEPHGEARVTLRSIQYGKYGLDSARVIASLNWPNATLDHATVYYGPLALDATGGFDLDDLTGDLACAFTDHGSYDDSAFADSASSLIHPVPAGLGKITVNIADSTNYQIELSGSDISLRPFAVLLLEDSISLDGELSFAGSIRGTYRNPRAQLGATLKRPRYDDVQIDSIIMRVSVDSSHVSIENLTLNGLGQQIAVYGRVGLERDSVGDLAVTLQSPVDGRAVARPLDLSAFRPFLPEGALIEGDGSLDLMVRGLLGEPHIDGEIRLIDASLSPAIGLDTLTDIQLHVLLQDSALIIRDARAKLRNSPITVQGNVFLQAGSRLITDLSFETERFGNLTLSGTAETDRLDLRARIDTLRLGAFSGFLPGLDTLGGRLSCLLSITGSPDFPVLDGALSIHNLIVKPTLLDSAITDGMATMTFTRQRASIDTLWARVGDGHVRARGWIEFGDTLVTGADLIISAQRATMASTGLFRLSVDSADLRFHGSAQAYRVEGPIALGDTRLTRDFDLTDIVALATSVEAIEREASALQRNTSIDIRLRDNGSLWVDNNLARIRLSAGTGIIGSIADPNLTGRIRIEEGYILYLDREFRITRGVAFFSDPNQINPDLDFSATTQLTSYTGSSSTKYTIVLDVSGPLEQYQLQLYSTSHPDLSRPDIISLLTVGATRQQLVGSSQGEVLADRAGELVSRRIAGYASSKVEETLGLSEVSVEGNLFAPNRNGGPQLLVSKNLSQRVRVTYSTRVGGANDQTIRLDYRLSDRWSFEGETNQVGEALLNVKYGLKFK